MKRRTLLKLAAACLAAPVLRYVPMPETLRQRIARLRRAHFVAMAEAMEDACWKMPPPDGYVMFRGMKIHYRSKLDTISWTKDEICSVARS